MADQDNSVQAPKMQEAIMTITRIFILTFSLITVMINIVGDTLNNP
jgi:hypothetical protein